MGAAVKGELTTTGIASCCEVELASVELRLELWASCCEDSEELALVPSTSPSFYNEPRETTLKPVIQGLRTKLVGTDHSWPKSSPDPLQL